MQGTNDLPSPDSYWFTMLSTNQNDTYILFNEQTLTHDSIGSKETQINFVNNKNSWVLEN